MKAKILTSLILCTLILISNFSINNGIKYPEARRDESQVDNYFGTNVSDPYQWLEDCTSDETKRFVSSQTKQTKQYLETNEHRSSILTIFESLYNHTTYGIPFKVGSKYYTTGKTGLQNQDTVYTMDSIDSREMKVFLDPNQMDSEGKAIIDYTIFSNDGRYCAYVIWFGGSDWSTLRIRDTKTLQDLPETLIKIKFSQVAWTPDNLGFFYSQYDEYNGPLDGTDIGTNKNQKLFYHKINTNQSDDIIITSFPGHIHRFIMELYVDSSGQFLHILPREDKGMVWSYAKLELPITKALKFTDIVKEPIDTFVYISSDAHKAYAITSKDAPNHRVIKIDLDDHSESKWTDIIKEHKSKVIKSVMPFKEYLVVVYIENVIDSLAIFKMNTGELVEELNMPMVGTVSGIGANGSTLLIKMTSLLKPGNIYQYDFNDRSKKCKIFKESKVSILDEQQFVTKQVFYPSKDGSVKVPMFIMHRRGLELDGSNPTLLYGYGGYGVITSPEYSPLGVFFANNLNGVYAVANIRGGGEYGETWHNSGAKTNRQNSFDDFASAAEYLIKNNYTRRERLVIHGESNGGLLVTVSSNQRPDLFGCAIAGFGTHDMVRYPLFTVGFAWTAEFGDPQTNATEFNYIYKYSPLHNIPANSTIYPAILLMTGDHDNRVIPAHTYKFGAQLQHTLGTRLADTPFMIRVDPNTGHEGKPVSKAILDDTDIVVFVLKSLRIDYQKTQSMSDVSNEVF